MGGAYHVRRVAAWWIHPRDAKGKLIPLRDSSLYNDDIIAWHKGLEDHLASGFTEAYYVSREGHRPVPNQYMQTWDDKIATHLQMYRDDIPVSEVMGSPELLVEWLLRHPQLGSTYTYMEWLMLIRYDLEKSSKPALALSGSTSQLPAKLDFATMPPWLPRA